MDYTKFPHEHDELADSINHVIEDNMKLSAELGRRNTPVEKWEKYQDLLRWISFCDRMRIKISNRSDVYGYLNNLWKDVKKSKIYKPKPKLTTQLED
jgi:hypothetical protein